MKVYIGDKRLYGTMVSLWFSDLFRRFIGVEESRVEIRGADSTLRKRPMVGTSCTTAILQRRRFVWRLIIRFITGRASSSKGCSFL